MHGSFDPSTGEVAACEELCGSHGGAGGWQQSGIPLHPVDLPVDAPGGEIDGAEALHAQLVRWLQALGHRRGLHPEVMPGGQAMESRPSQVSPPGP